LAAALLRLLVAGGELLVHERRRPGVLEAWD
jgi:hypothetical protein